MIVGERNATPITVDAGEVWCRWVVDVFSGREFVPQLASRVAGAEFQPASPGNGIAPSDRPNVSFRRMPPGWDAWRHRVDDDARVFE